MAGVTDQPFRKLCRSLGADLAVSEMVKAHQYDSASLAQSARSRLEDEPGPRSVQIIGNDPSQMAAAAKLNADQGADIIDINMGCPAKKFGKKPAGSALLAHPDQVKRILESVVKAVDVPVTVKIRTGLDEDSVNALEIGLIAENAGIQALTIHGRTREQKFRGQAEHQTTRLLVQALNIPVFANGDIDSPDMAQEVLEVTGASGLVIGRAARKNPWIFQEIKQGRKQEEINGSASLQDKYDCLKRHLERLYHYYDESKGIEMAGKQIGWCVSGYAGAAEFRRHMLQSQSKAQQSLLLDEFFKSIEN